MSKVENVERLAQAFESLTETITVYYHATGQGNRWGCGCDTGMIETEGRPTFSIDVVPSTLRDRMAKFIVGAGIELHRGTGGAGDGAYFRMYVDSLDKDKITRLRKKLESEVERLTKKSYARYAAETRVVREFLGASVDSSEQEALALLKEVVAGVKARLPRRAAEEIGRKIETIQRELGGRE